MSFISIVFVLYIHSQFTQDEIAGMHTNDYIQTFWSGMVGRCAVPLFYMISGYLFFLNVPNGMQSVFGKIRKRVRTLLIPYIIGCLFFVGFYVIVEMMPGTSRFLNNSMMSIFQQPLAKLLCATFYGINGGMPYAFQLWFLRDLILIVLTSPLWYALLRQLGWWCVCIVFMLTYVDIPCVPVLSLFWFIFGGQLAKSTLLNWGGITIQE